MELTVYVVTKWYDYEGESRVGVASTFEGAEMLARVHAADYARPQPLGEFTAVAQPWDGARQEWSTTPRKSSGYYIREETVWS